MSLTLGANPEKTGTLIACSSPFSPHRLPTGFPAHPKEPQDILWCSYCWSESQMNEIPYSQYQPQGWAMQTFYIGIKQA